MASVATASTLEQIVATVGELPSSPTIVSAVMGLTSNLDSEIDEVSKAISADQSLTAKVLKLSNSTFFGRPKEVKSLQEAIMVLGFFNVRSMVVATSAHSLYTHGESDGATDRLWRHSLASAIAARQIARHIAHPAPEEMFIAALLHDIGKLVLLQKLAKQYRPIVQTVEKDRVPFWKEEARVLGFTHCDIAGVLLAEWSFPPEITEAIARHHSLPEYDPEMPIPAAYVIHLANHLAKRLGVGFDDADQIETAKLVSAITMQLDQEELDELLQTIDEQYRDEGKILDGE